MLFPNFWLKLTLKTAIAVFLLYPFSILWISLNKLRMIYTTPTLSKIPVICVGNLTIGGNGKTPTSIKVQSLLRDEGYKPHILSKGYKGKLKGPHLVNSEKDSFIDVGDEALMMSFYGPTWIARDRRAGIKSIIAAGADVIILDDGFQNNSIKKDFSILVIETTVGFGNGYLIPAGPLREHIASGMNRADAIVTIGDDKAQAEFMLNNSFMKEIRTIKGKLIPKKKYINLKKKKVVAFAGIAHPKKFKITLNELGANIIKFKEFTNHKFFKLKYLEDLITCAKKHNALLITTEKDFMRIPKKLRHNFQILKVELEFHNQKVLMDKLRSVI